MVPIPIRFSSAAEKKLAGKDEIKDVIYQHTNLKYQEFARAKFDLRIGVIDSATSPGWPGKPISFVVKDKYGEKIVVHVKLDGYYSKELLAEIEMTWANFRKFI